jgi:hypothetical protein
MKLRRIGWAGNVARVGEDKNAYIFFFKLGDLKERNYLEEG